MKKKKTIFYLFTLAGAFAFCLWVVQGPLTAVEAQVSP